MGWIVWFAILPAPAGADTDELSLRPFAVIHQGEAAGPDERTADALSVGGGLLLGYGLDYHWSTTLRYQLDITQALQSRAETLGRSVRWRQRRHVALAGLAVTSHDHFSPWLALEGGVAVRQVADGREVITVTGQREATLPETSDLITVARASAGLEWRVTDFWALALSGYGEWADAPGYGAALWIGWYHYLNLR